MNGDVVALGVITIILAALLNFSSGTSFGIVIFRDEAFYMGLAGLIIIAVGLAAQPKAREVKQ